MQKKIIALAVTALVSGVAFAQSNVAIYGVVDMGLAQRSNSQTKADSQTKIDDGISAGSRLGFKGTEDLGNGWSALFTLENGFAADTGDMRQGGRLFGRQAFMGLTNASAGTVIAGRLYAPHYSFVSAIDPFKGGTVGMYRNVFAAGVSTGGENLFDPTRVDNTIAYVSPSFSGFSVTAAYSTNAIGQEVTKDSDAKVIALLPRYTNGPLDVGFSYHRIKVSSGTVIVDDPKITNWVLGGTYDFGAVKLHAFYDQNKLKTPNVGHDGKKMKTFLVGLSAPFGQNAVQVSYTQSKLRDNSDAKDAKASQIALGYTRNLSKRTNFYAAYATISNEKKDGDYLRNADVGDSSNSVSHADGYQRGFQLGLKHTF
ncbi:MAG: porin [Zoogloeaceae bacterium]|jgi:predicted porin|nr:porin [Zoogloeaceae bacterium]